MDKYSYKEAQKEASELQEGKKRGVASNFEEAESQVDAWKEVADARKEYLEIDYKKNTAFKRARKFFGNLKKGKEEKGLENDQDIAWYRAQYDNKLFDLQKLLLENAKANGADDKKLAELYAEFRTEQKITLEKEHDIIKAEQLFGTRLGKMGKMTEDFFRRYQKWSFKEKMLLSGALFAGGLAIGSFGVGAATLFVALRRGFGGGAAGFGMKGGLEAMGQRKSKKEVEEEEQEFLKELEGKSDDGKYEFLSGKIKNVAIKDEENSINKIKNQDIRQTVAGIGVGTFIGSGAMADLIKWGYHGVVDYFGGGHHIDTAKLPQGTKPSASAISSNSNLAGTKFPEPPKSGMFAGAKPDAGGVIDNNKIPKGYGGVAGGAENIQGGHGPANPVEAANLKGATTEVLLNIKEGSSFEGTLIKFLNNESNLKEFLKYRPEFAGKSNGFIADRLALEFAQKHEEMHGHLPDYVQAGAKLRLSMNTGGFNMEITNKDYGWYEQVAQNKSGGASALPKADIAQPIVDNTIPYNPEHDYQKAETEMEAQENLDDLTQKRSDLTNKLMSEHINDPSPLRDSEEYRNIEDAYDKAKENLQRIKAENIPWEKYHGINELLAHGAGSKEIVRESLQKITAGSSDRVAAWHGIKDKPFFEVFEGSLHKGLRNTLQEFKGILGVDAIPKTDLAGKQIETTGKWLARVTKAALKHGHISKSIDTTGIDTAGL